MARERFGSAGDAAVPGSDVGHEARGSHVAFLARDTLPAGGTREPFGIGAVNMGAEDDAFVARGRGIGFPGKPGAKANDSPGRTASSSGPKKSCSSPEGRNKIKPFRPKRVPSLSVGASMTLWQSSQ